MSNIVMGSVPQIVCGGWMCTQLEPVVTHLGKKHIIELHGLTHEDVGDLAKVLKQVCEWRQE